MQFCVMMSKVPQMQHYLSAMGRKFQYSSVPLNMLVIWLKWRISKKEWMHSISVCACLQCFIPSVWFSLKNVWVNKTRENILREYLPTSRKTNIAVVSSQETTGSFMSQACAESIPTISAHNICWKSNISLTILLNWHWVNKSEMYLGSS